MNFLKNIFSSWPQYLHCVQLLCFKIAFPALLPISWLLALAFEFPGWFLGLQGPMEPPCHAGSLWKRQYAKGSMMPPSTSQGSLRLKVAPDFVDWLGTCMHTGVGVDDMLSPGEGSCEGAGGYGYNRIAVKVFLDLFLKFSDIVLCYIYIHQKDTLILL